MKIRKIKKKSKILVRAKLVAEQVCLNQAEYSKLSINDLKIRTDYLIDGLAKKKFALDDIVVDAFSIAREIIYREHGLLAFPVQIMGAFVVHSGDFAEMYTGEGKTLTLLLVSFLNALAKKGVHIVTVNEYLVQRDAEFARIAFEKLGITVGYNISQLSKEAKKEMFARDITYTTNSELGFDYLRDNMVRSIEEKVIRNLFFVIVDEGDSVLIDEARTPLIISGQPKEDFTLYLDVDKFVKSIEKNDYTIDSESNTIALSESGVTKAESFFNLPNLYSVESAEIVHKITNGLIANYIFANGREYLVKDDKIYLVDQFTGRILEGRSYNAGLQQAIQAKERVKIEPENVVMATITYQSFFRLYERLSAVSGTAMTEAEEFLKIYNMVVVKVPTNKPIQRIDQIDYVFGTKKVKWNHVVEEIVNRHKKGQPILVGTASVTDSEIIHERLNKLNIPHEVLNARDNSREAEIVKHAGELGAVTISTNMAGRGTDIKVNDEVRKLGGLYVLGTERHESRRIDNQLRGRTGRQGDPGESRFFISLEDSLFKRYASERISKASEKLEEDYYNSSFFSRMLNSTQKKVEGLNFDIRKNLMDYDHVLSLQRELIYKQRDQILLKTNSLKIITNMAKDYSQIVALSNINKENSVIIDTDSTLNFIHQNILKFDFFHLNDFEGLTISLAAEKIFEIIKTVIETKYKILEEINALDSLSELLLVNLDQKWTIHIDKMIKLREGVHLRSLEQRSPLNIYIEDGNNLFEKMKSEIVTDVILGACKLSLPNEREKIEAALTSLVSSKEFKKKISNDLQSQTSNKQENLPSNNELLDNEDSVLTQPLESTNREILEDPVNYDALKEIIEEPLTSHVSSDDNSQQEMNQQPIQSIENNHQDDIQKDENDFLKDLDDDNKTQEELVDNDSSEDKPLLLGDYIKEMLKKYSKQDDNNDSIDKPIFESEKQSVDNNQQEFKDDEPIDDNDEQRIDTKNIGNDSISEPTLNNSDELVGNNQQEIENNQPIDDKQETDSNNIGKDSDSELVSNNSDELIGNNQQEINISQQTSKLKNLPNELIFQNKNLPINDNQQTDNSSEQIEKMNDVTFGNSNNEESNLIILDDDIDQKISNKENVSDVVDKVFKSDDNKQSDLQNKQNVSSPKGSLSFYKLPDVSPKPIGKLFDSKNSLNNFDDKFSIEDKLDNNSTDYVDNLKEKQKFDSTPFVDDEQDRLEKIKNSQIPINKDEISIDSIKEEPTFDDSKNIKLDIDSLEKVDLIENDAPISAAYFINENFSIPEIDKIKKDDSQPVVDNNDLSDEENLVDKILKDVQYRNKKNEYETEIINEIRKNSPPINSRKRKSFDEQIISLIWEKSKK